MAYKTLGADQAQHWRPTVPIIDGRFVGIILAQPVMDIGYSGPMGIRPSVPKVCGKDFAVHFTAAHLEH